MKQHPEKAFIYILFSRTSKHAKSARCTQDLQEPVMGHIEAKMHLKCKNAEVMLA